MSRITPVHDSQVEYLFRRMLESREKQGISAILKTLARYIVLTKDQLEKRLLNKDNMHYLNKVIKNQLVICYESKNLEFFTLDTKGYYFLERINFAFNELMLDAASWEISRIITANKYMISKGYNLHSIISVSSQYDYFVTNENKILYFKDRIEQDRIAQLLHTDLVALKIYNSQSDIDVIFKDFKFETIDIDTKFIGSYKAEKNIL